MYFYFSLFIYSLLWRKACNNYSYIGLIKEKNTEAAIRKCSTKQVLLKISQKL